MKTHKTNYSKAAQLTTFWALSALLSPAFVPQALAFSTHAETSTSESSPQLISQVDSEAQREREAFDNSSIYTFDDADDLAALWGMSTAEAKAYIGRKILQGESALEGLDEALVEAHEKADAADLAQDNVYREAFYSSDYTYDDAEALDDLPELLEEARAQADAPSDSTGNSQRNAFYDSDYSYEDAEDLADFWGVSVSDAKTRIGEKILSGEDSVAELEEILEEVQSQESAAEPSEGEEARKDGEEESSQQSQGDAADREPSRWGSVVSAVGRFFGSLFG